MVLFALSGIDLLALKTEKLPLVYTSMWQPEEKKYISLPGIEKKVFK